MTARKDEKSSKQYREAWRRARICECIAKDDKSLRNPVKQCNQQLCHPHNTTYLLLFSAPPSEGFFIASIDVLQLPHVPS